MSGVFDYKELDRTPARRDTELTLSPTMLLVLFFALVALCGLCFGLGYSSGRQATEKTDSELPPAQGATQASGAKPAAVSQAQTSGQQTASQQTTGPAQNGVSGAGSAASGSGTGSQPSVQPAFGQVLPSQPGQMAAGSVGPALGQTAQVMVQIASVSQQEDADVLVGALKKHGYTVTARREPLDGLIHVKIGPFKTAAEAESWRQKLLNDGYNAEVQQ